MIVNAQHAIILVHGLSTTESDFRHIVEQVKDEDVKSAVIGSTIKISNTAIIYSVDDEVFTKRWTTPVQMREDLQVVLDEIGINIGFRTDTELLVFFD